MRRSATHNWVCNERIRLFSEQALDKEEKYSAYSLFFANQTPEQMEIAVASLIKPIEPYRFHLDFGLITANAADGKRFLDFPIGTGRLAKHFAEKFDLFGFDINPNYIELARNNFKDSPPSNFQVFSFEEMDFKGDLFDNVISMRVLYSIKDKERAFASISGLLRQGGRWMFSLPPVPTVTDAENWVRETASAHGMRLVTRVRYDCHAGHAKAPILLRGFWRRAVIPLCARGWLSRDLFSKLDGVLAKMAGTDFYVLEKL